MLVSHDAQWEPERAGDGLNAAERELLWCLRRLAMLRPLGSARDGHVHVALQLRFGDVGLGVEHLLRCLIVGLAQRALRPLLLHRPCCAGCSADEVRLLLALRNPAQAALLMAPMAGARGGELEPILAGLGALIRR
jgi:hypothetical protein